MSAERVGQVLKAMHEGEHAEATVLALVDIAESLERIANAVENVQHRGAVLVHVRGS